VFVPDVWPSVQTAWATPSPFEITISGVTDPSPAVVTNFTRAFETAAPRASTTRIDTGTVAPTVAEAATLPLAEISLAGPAGPVESWHAVSASNAVSDGRRDGRGMRKGQMKRLGP
jgi:hypothetical protein